MTAPRVLFYVQHLLGIGHLARASRIAGALSQDGFEVVIVTGGAPVAGFPGAGMRHVELPAVTAAEGFSGLLDQDGNAVDDAFKARRRDVLLTVLAEMNPHVVVLEAFPFGRRQMRFELLPLIDAVAAMTPRPRLVSSVRDILQERAKPGRNAETVDLLNRHFDLVMIHGDPAFARIEDTFPEASAITTRIGYTGLVAAPRGAPASERFDVVVSAGGGAAGAALVEAAVAAARLLPPTLRWALITGPNLPAHAYDRAVASAPDGMHIFRFRRDFASLLSAAELSVSQAGYNTVCDILRAGCRAILVPFSAGGETEQSARAERLSQLGAAMTIVEAELSAISLAAAISTALAGPKPPATTLDLDGARRIGEMLRQLG